GLSLAPERRRIGYVPQDALLFPHLTVEENVRFGATSKRSEPAVDEAVKILEIGGLLERFPATLSGGERQRVALARAIATSPRLRSGMPAEADPDWRVENIVAGVIVSAGEPGDVAHLRAGDSDLQVPASGAAGPGARVVYAVSPDEIVASTLDPEHLSARNVLRGRVLAAGLDDDGSSLRVAAGGLEWTVRLTRS